MSDKRSFPFRIAAKHQDDDKMSFAIEEELYQVSHRAAEPVRPGETVKAQLNRAWLNLGKPPMWRLKSAWYRDGSNAWSAQSVRDFQNRFVRWREAETRRAAASAATERARRSRLDRAVLERSRAEAIAALARIESQIALIGEEGGEPA